MPAAPRRPILLRRGEVAHAEARMIDILPHHGYYVTFTPEYHREAQHETWLPRHFEAWLPKRKERLECWVADYSDPAVILPYGSKIDEVRKDRYVRAAREVWYLHMGDRVSWD